MPEPEQRALKPLPQSIPAVLMRAREVVMARVRPVLRAYGLTEPQWRVLRTLGSLDEIEVTQLAEMVFLLPSSLSRILRDLGERGLVRRRTSLADLRRGLVSASPEGMAMIEAVTPEAAKVNREIETLYGPERMKRLRAMLVELEHALGWAQPSE
ncbi:MAG: homoprotocatechuate degradation operon regulator HpaR [Caulobacteraceae bacterium]